MYTDALNMTVVPTFVHSMCCIVAFLCRVRISITVIPMELNTTTVTSAIAATMNSIVVFCNSVTSNEKRSIGKLCSVHVLMSSDIWITYYAQYIQN